MFSTSQQPDFNPRDLQGGGREPTPTSPPSDQIITSIYLTNTTLFKMATSLFRQINVSKDSDPNLKMSGQKCY